MNVFAAFKLIKSAKDVVDYVTKDNILDKGQETLAREIKVLKKEVNRLNEITDEQRKIILDLITKTHPLIMEQEQKERMEKEFSIGDKE